MNDPLSELAEEVHARLPQSLEGDPVQALVNIAGEVLDEWRVKQPAKYAFVMAHFGVAASLPNSGESDPC